MSKPKKEITLKIHGSFDDVIKAAVKGNPKSKKTEKKLELDLIGEWKTKEGSMGFRFTKSDYLYWDKMDGRFKGKYSIEQNENGMVVNFTHKPHNMIVVSNIGSDNIRVKIDNDGVLTRLLRG